MALGEGCSKKAKKYLWSSIIIAECGAAIMIVVYLAFTEDIAKFFLTDASAISYTVSMLRLFMVALPADYCQMLLSAGLRALNRASVGLYTSMGVLYLVALPCCYFFTFHTDMEVVGLIMGPLIGYYCMMAIYVFYYMVKLDW